MKKLIQPQKKLIFNEKDQNNYKKDTAIVSEKGQNENEKQTWDEAAFFGCTHCDTSAEHSMVI